MHPKKVGEEAADTMMAMMMMMVVVMVQEVEKEKTVNRPGLNVGEVFISIG